MTLDLDTFLTALYTIVDDLYKQHCAHHKPIRPGRQPKLSDSEVLTLMIYRRTHIMCTTRSIGEG